MGSLSIFDSQKTPLKIDKPIRLIELFAGIGSQAKALKRLGANFEHYRICEFDKYAIKSYNAVHGTDFETSDITEITAADLGIVDTDKYCYIMTYSFPCQDLSLAGKGKGMAKGDNTRSGLLWEVERLLNECDQLPQILLMENVTQVHGKNNKEHFKKWCEYLESKGYSNYWKDLNAKNFGIPQNRNRTFMVSVLGDYTYEFPEEFPLELRLKDMLETEVDEKFYISNAQMEKIVNWKAQQKPFERVLGRESIVQTITARGAGENHSGMIVYSSENENTTNMQSQIIKVCQLEGTHEQSGRVYSANGISPTVMSNSHGNTSGGYTPPKVIDPFIVASRGRNPENPSDRTAGIHLEQRLEPNFSGCTNTLTTVQKDNYVCEPQVLRAERTEYGKAIRKKYESGEIDEKIGNMREMKPRTDGVSNTITTLLKDNYVAEPLAYDEQNGYIHKDGIVGTLTTNGSSPKHNNRVIEPIRLGYIPYPNSDKAHQSNTFYDENAISPTLDTCTGGNRQVKIQQTNLRIRKLTPKECWRLMGFDDTDFEKAAATNSNTQLYKQAGNSIVVDVLYYIFREML